MAKSQSEKITDFIGKLEQLKEAIERHSAYHRVRGRSHLGLSPDSTERSFIEAVKELIIQADSSLVGLEDCIVQHSLPTDGLGGHYFPPSGRFGHDLLHDIRYAITSCYREETSTTDSKEVNRLILHLKKVLQRLETEAAKPMPPTKTPTPPVKVQDPGTEDAGSKGKQPAKSVYVELNLAERSLTIGTNTKSVSSESVWNFLKTLADNKKQGQIIPTCEMRDGGNIYWKNSMDMLRRMVNKMVGKNGIQAVVESSRNGYQLAPGVKITGGAQVGIRPTKLGPPK
jgi:hypothetical protein